MRTCINTLYLETALKRGLLSIGLAVLLGFATATSSVGGTLPTSGKPFAALGKVGGKAQTKKASRPRTKAARVTSPRPLTKAGLRRMFRDRTWLWANGAAYFAPDGRFAAWAGRKAKASYAYGSWRIRPNGRLCFRANWVSRSGSGRAESCFGHGSTSGDILQRKLPNGKWYVFKHRRTRANDEVRKLVIGDRVSAQAKRIKATLQSGRS
jgi:hypothetical protein